MIQQPESTWGHSSRYYSGSGSTANASAREHPRYPKWEEALERAQPGIEDAVARTYKQFNAPIRDVLRSETGLRLSTREANQSVPIRVVAGIPSPVAQVLDKLDGLELLMMNRPLIEAAARGTDFMQRYLASAEHLWGDETRSATTAEIEIVRDTARMWLEKLEQERPIDELLGIDHDILGAYYFRVPEVRLHWVVIGIVARTLGIRPEALTVVVQAHELAHAYTHLGFDIDRGKWDTERFAFSHLDIVEGLAQFYTAVVCVRLEERMPGVTGAFQALLAKQAGPYRAHLGWVREREPSGEIIRASMIECRTKGITQADAFEETIKKNRRGIRPGSTEDYQL